MNVIPPRRYVTITTTLNLLHHHQPVLPSPFSSTPLHTPLPLPWLKLLSIQLTSPHLSPSQHRQIHAHMLTSGLLLLLKGSPLSLNIPRPDRLCHNLLIRAMSDTSNPLKSMWVYRQLLAAGHLRPNEYTLCFLLHGCSRRGAASLWEGREIHAHLVKLGIGSGVFAATSLVHMYGQGGVPRDARKVFDEMPERTEASWGALIGACVLNGDVAECFGLFREMGRSGIQPGNAAMVGILCGCGAAGELGAGRAVHAFLVLRGLDLNVTLGTSLLDMYAKCGDTNMASVVFATMPAKSTASWNCMINGFAMNGCGRCAVKLFDNMLGADVPPNCSTYVAVLNACSHAGLVEEGISCFNSMRTVHGIQPSLKHLGCMVDLCSRAGRIEEAVAIVQAMPMKPDATIWGALFVACKRWGFVVLGEAVGAQVVKLVTLDACGYLMLCDMYAMCRRWEGVSKVREMMVKMKVRKVPGWSSITGLNGESYN